MQRRWPRAPVEPLRETCIIPVGRTAGSWAPARQPKLWPAPRPSQDKSTLEECKYCAGSTANRRQQQSLFDTFPSDGDGARCAKVPSIGFPLEKIVAIIKHGPQLGLRDTRCPTRSSTASVLEAERTRVKPPPLYKVVLLNDDYTPMDFVVDRAPNCVQHESGKSHAGHAAGSPRGHGRLRHVHARGGGEQGGPGHRPRTQASASAAVHDGGDLSVKAVGSPRRVARRAGNGFRRGNEVKEAT